MLNLSRRLNELDLANMAANHGVLISLFQKYGSHIQTLTIHNSKIDDFTFREILKLCVELKILVISEVAIIKKLPAINSVFIANLKNLSIHYCDWQILKFFMRSQLHTLEINSYLDEGNRKNLVDFLTCQFALKKLKLHGTSLRTLFQNKDVNDQCCFSLTEFCTDNAIGKNSDAVNWNVTTFLNLHDGTLTNVEILGPHNENIAAFALINLKSLSSLTLDCRSLPKNREFYDALADEPCNEMLQNLKLCGFFSQPEFVKVILMKFPQIRNLELDDWSKGSMSTLLQFVSQNLIQIRNLTLTEISGSENIKLQSLKKLSVYFIRSAKKLAKFIGKNDSVDTLNVSLLYNGQIENFVKFLHYSNIKILSVGGNKSSLKNVLNLIQSSPPQMLKLMKLSLVSEEKTKDVRKAITLNVPFNLIDLNLKCKVLMI